MTIMFELLNIILDKIIIYFYLFLLLIAIYEKNILLSG